MHEMLQTVQCDFGGLAMACHGKEASLSLNWEVHHHAEDVPKQRSLLPRLSLHLFSYNLIIEVDKY